MGRAPDSKDPLTDGGAFPSVHPERVIQPEAFSVRLMVTHSVRHGLNHSRGEDVPCCRNLQCHTHINLLCRDL